MRRCARLTTAAALAAAASVAAGIAPAVASAAGAPQTLAGSCTFSGPIEPNPPITVFPKPGAHFSYQGTGTCSGTFDGAAVTAAPTAVTFTDVETVFDTCELGPDFGLGGTMSVRVGQATADFPITINLARLALVGPFTVTTPGGGAAIGTAQFTPPDETTAVQECVGAGIGLATLSASFSTLSPLVGSTAPSPAAVPRLAVRWRRRHIRHRRFSA